MIGNIHIKLRNQVWALSASVFAFAAMGSLAWACTPQQQISLLPRSGPAGSTISLQSDSFAPGTAVEIRWNAVNGTRVATGLADTQGHLSVLWVVPDVADGIYFVVAASGDLELAREVLMVKGATAGSVVSRSSGGGPAVDSSAADLWEGFASHRAAPQSLTQSPAETRREAVGVRTGWGLVGPGLAGIVSILALATLKVSVRKKAGS